MLKEKRQALISHAVTKGLNPDAPMKDSGVEWLGEVPEHWKVSIVRRVATTVDTGATPSKILPSVRSEAGISWYTPGDFGEQLRLTQAAKKIPLAADIAEEVKLFEAGCVFVVSIGATLGKVGYSLEISSANQQINIIKPNPEVVDGYFLAYSLSVKRNNMVYLSNASTIGIMNQDKTKETWLAVPPLSEQKIITDFLDVETINIDMLIQEAEAVIVLLYERRMALVSDVVTGKIDVRWSVEDVA